jgi:hypothetical protein
LHLNRAAAHRLNMVLVVVQRPNKLSARGPAWQ